jgi:hypothetical protein
VQPVLVDTGLRVAPHAADFGACRIRGGEACDIAWPG